MLDKKTKPLQIFFVLGIVLLALSYAMKDTSITDKSFASGLFNQVGFIILTVVIINWLWEVMGGEPISETLAQFRSTVRLLNDSHVSGIERVVPVSGEFGNHGDWMERLRSANREVDLMGYSLHVWTRGYNFQEEVEELVKRGVNLRIMIMDEDNQNISCFVDNPQIPYISIEQVKEEIRIVKRIFETLIEKMDSSGDIKNGSLKFRTIKRGIASCQICRTDNEMTIVCYLYSIVVSHSPLFLIRGHDSKLYSTYLKEFNSLWELNDPNSQRDKDQDP